MNIFEMQKLLKSTVAEMEKLVADNPESMDSETAEKFDALDAKVEQLKANIARAEKVQKNADAFAGSGRESSFSSPAKPKDKEEEERGGFENFSEFALSVKAARDGYVDDRLKFLGAPSTTIHKEKGTEDGYMVPAALKAEVFEVDTQDFNILPLVDSEPTSSNHVKMLADESTPWGSTGIQAYWTSEAGQMTRSKLETKGKLVELHKVHAFVEASEELLSDEPRLNSRLTTGSNRAINWKLNQGVFEGDGVGKMLGFANSASKIVQAKESGQAADTIVAKNIIKMYARSTNPGGSIWIVNRSVLAELMTMTIGNQPIWIAPTGLNAPPGGFLLGRPVYFSQHADVLGEEGDVHFVDPMGYYMPNRGTIVASQSMHLLFDYDVQAFKWTFRAGGRPYLSAPVLPAKGTTQQKADNSMSSYIVLAARA